MTLLATQGLNALSYGMLLFLLAVGLTLTLGLLRVTNLTHGAYYLLGGQLAIATIALTGTFLAGLAVAALSMGALGWWMERSLLGRYARDERAQVVLSLGLLFLLGDLSHAVWGGTPRTVPLPAFLQGTVAIGDQLFPVYRLALVAAGAIVALVLGLIVERTRAGMMLRATADDPDLAQAMRVNVPLVRSATFSAGALLAGGAGALGGPLIGTYPGVEMDVLLLALVVVIVGGLGSVRGAVVGALLVGTVDTVTRASFPDLALFGVFAPLAVILAVRPQGLFGRTA